MYHNIIQYIVASIYRPPTSSIEVINELKKYLCTHAKSGARIILSGDFNLPDIDWTSLSTTKHNDIIGEAMLDVAFTFDLLQVVHDFTRVQGSSKSVLDLFFVSGCIKSSATCEVVPGISDHSAVLLTLANGFMTRKRKTSCFRNFLRADDTSVIDLLSLNFDSFLNSTADVQGHWDSFKDLVNECIDRFVPCVVKKKKERNPWISRDTLHLKRKLKRLKKRRSLGNIAGINEEISEIATKLKHQIHIDKQLYYGESLPNFIKTCPERFWRSIKPTSTECNVFVVDGVDVHDSKVISNAFNQQFKSVFTIDNNVLPSFDADYPPIPDVVISEHGILNMLLKLNVKKTPGPDSIPNAFLKRYAEWIAKYLYVLFSKSLHEGRVPDDWRAARVKPLYKSGKKQLISNYRPISLTSTTCKLIEHIIHTHISEFLSKHNILTKHQHGFRKGYSTCTQLVETIHDFATSINNGTQTDAIFMDFSKAFDKVSHKKLLFKLEKTLKNPRLIKWIADYLINRKQFVVFNECCSEEATVDSGVPQGTVLGPLLFLIFINDIVNEVPVKIKLYADDCVIYSEISNVTDQIILNSAFYNIVKWCDLWQMSINFDKTVFMRITHKKKPLLFNYSTASFTLSEVTNIKYLGIWITNDLSWTKHIDSVITNANRKLFFLRRALKHSNSTVRTLAYRTIIRPVLEYGVIVWDPFTKANITKLENVQKKAVRFIFNSFGRTSITELLHRANEPSVTERNRLIRLQFLYQIIKGHYKLDVSNIISFSSGYATRQRHQLTITPFRSRNNCFKYSFFPRTVTQWNGLTNNQVMEPSLELFAANLT